MGRALAGLHASFKAFAVPKHLTQFVIAFASLAVLGSSAPAVGSFLIQGRKETGPMPVYCLPLYAAPWLPLALVASW